MMYSEKLESIPKSKSQALKTYLSRAYSKDLSHIRRRKAAVEIGLDEATVQTILSELTSEGILQAVIQIRCPYCTTQHGRYGRRGEIPKESRHCFDCGNDFNLDKKSNWEVIYKVAEDPGDFFQEFTLSVEWYQSKARDLPAEFFEQEFSRLEDMDNPQKRGRKFDYFMGLLFHQLPSVEVRLQESGGVGEVDVHVICFDAPDWIFRLVGRHTIIENKWLKNPVEKSDISIFHRKASDITGCEAAYFASMSGFSDGSKKDAGALGEMQKCKEPPLRGLWDDDIEEMVTDGTPENILRDRVLK